MSTAPSALLGALLLTLAAACGASPSTPPTSTPPVAPAGPLKAPGEASVGDRTTCPVSKEEFVVTPNSPKAMHDGKTYYFCCAGCSSKFAKDPKAFLPSGS